MSLDNALWLAAVVAEASVVTVLLLRRVWRTLPIFFLFCIWTLVTDAGNYPISSHVSSANFLNVYLLETAIDSTLQFCVLVELAWSVLRPIRASLPRATLFVLIGLILAVGAAVWPFSDIHGDLSSQGHLLMHLLQTVSIMRVLFFLALAGCSQLLSLGWRDRELQVATGLGIYSLASLGVAMLHTHGASGTQNMLLNQYVVGSYLLSLAYWIVSFAQKPAERREFTPQMQNMLLAVAGVARSDRAALARPKVTDSQKHRDR